MSGFLNNVKGSQGTCPERFRSICLSLAELKLFEKLSDGVGGWFLLGLRIG